MADITASMVKELREMTGAGMMECKKALTATEGNIDAAVDWLREKGLAAAQKKAGRIAAEGIVKAIVDGRKAALVEVNSETDFVAKNADFQSYVAQVAEQALDSESENIEAFLAEPWKFDTTKTVEQELSTKISVIGEKLSIRRFKKLIAEEGPVVSYIHGAGRIGVLVEGKCEADNDDVNEALKNIAMQIAAMNPQYISRDDMSEEELEKLKKITAESALNTPDTLPRPILMRLINQAVDEKVWSEDDIRIYGEQKNNMQYLFNFLSDEAKAQLAGLAVADKENIFADKIFAGLVDGRYAKQLKDICLLDQVYVRAEDGKQTVSKYLEEVSKKLGTALTIKQVVRFETGEGMEKRSENFADEVAAQMAGK